METYHGVRVAPVVPVDNVGQKIGPELRGLPRPFVEERPELAWMLDQEQEGPETDEAPFDHVWVLASSWESFREGE